LWALNVELDFCHSSGVQNFELVPRVFENTRTAILIYYLETEENTSSVKPRIGIEQNLYFISEGRAVISPSFTAPSEDLSPLASSTINTGVSTLW
jgi:hypothetical protein